MSEVLLGGAAFLSAALSVSLGACVPAASAPEAAPEARGATLEEAPGRVAPTAGRTTPLVARTLATMSRVRHLAAMRPVPSLTLGRRALLAEVKRHVDREVPPSAIRAEGLVQKLLGFFPTAADYEAATYALLLGQLAGYYEPANGTMYLAADLDEANTSSTLAHELVHALQDQHWDLRARSIYVAGQDDKDSALAALAEGDATSAMEDETRERTNPGTTALDEPDADFARALEEEVGSGPAASAPHALRMALVAPYVDGVAFVNALRRQGGWGAVDDAWATPPVTTEQILHPDKWRTHEPAIVVPAPAGPLDGFVRLSEDTYGEQGLRLTFAEWMPFATARAAASGWGGDRGALYVRANREVAYLWRVRFDDASPAPPDAFAKRAFAAMTVALPRVGRVAEAGERSLCVERPRNGVFAVQVDARDLFMTFGTVDGDAHGWRALMSCADALRWSTSVRSAQP